MKDLVKNFEIIVRKVGKNLIFLKYIFLIPKFFYDKRCRS